MYCLFINSKNNLFIKSTIFVLACINDKITRTNKNVNNKIYLC